MFPTDTPIEPMHVDKQSTIVYYVYDPARGNDAANKTIVENAATIAMALRSGKDITIPMIQIAGAMVPMYVITKIRTPENSQVLTLPVPLDAFVAEVRKIVDSNSKEN